MGAFSFKNTGTRVSKVTDKLHNKYITFFRSHLCRIVHIALPIFIFCINENKDEFSLLLFSL